jgi:hypothetical protein
LSAAYKGLAALLMKNGSRDLISGTPVDINAYFNNAIDVHHIFPRAWCEKNNLLRDKWNSVVNKATIAAATNRFISGDAPNVYLGKIETKKEISTTDLNAFLESHAIPVEKLRSNDFNGFMLERTSFLLLLIEQATGKAISGRESEQTVKAFGGVVA